jgi:hypothetical protein
MDYARFLRQANEKRASRQQQINSAREAAASEKAAREAAAAAAAAREAAAAAAAAREAVAAAAAAREAQATAATPRTNQIGADPIESLYQGILGRESDPAGKQHWQKELNAGRSINEIRQDFLNSAEFTGKNR